MDCRVCSWRQLAGFVVPQSSMLYVMKGLRIALFISYQCENLELVFKGIKEVCFDCICPLESIMWLLRRSYLVAAQDSIKCQRLEWQNYVGSLKSRRVLYIGWVASAPILNAGRAGSIPTGGHCVDQSTTNRKKIYQHFWRQTKTNITP